MTIETCAAHLGHLALLFHGQRCSFERELGFDAPIDSLSPLLVRLGTAPLTCSKARLKKSTSSCLVGVVLRPS
jgi:hypothetical protein